jgi:hypothetical protein
MFKKIINWLKGRPIKGYVPTAAADWVTDPDSGLATIIRTQHLIDDALARQAGKNLDDSPRRETYPQTLRDHDLRLCTDDMYLRAVNARRAKHGLRPLTVEDAKAAVMECDDWPYLTGYLIGYGLPPSNGDDGPDRPAPLPPSNEATTLDPAEIAPADDPAPSRDDNKPGSWPDGMTVTIDDSGPSPDDN